MNKGKGITETWRQLAALEPEEFATDCCDPPCLWLAGGPSGGVTVGIHGEDPVLLLGPLYEWAITRFSDMPIIHYDGAMKTFTATFRGHGVGGQTMLEAAAKVVLRALKDEKTGNPGKPA